MAAHTSSGSKDAATEEVVQTICGLCSTNCGMRIRVKNGQIAKVAGDPTHPANRGRLCVKGAAIGELVNSPQRLRYPLVKTDKGFEQTSWDNALDFTARRLLEIRERYGPEALVLSRGGPSTEECFGAFSQLVAAYGSANVTAPSHLCHWPNLIAFNLVHGDGAGAEVRDAKCVVVWAGNPPDTNRLGEGGLVYGRHDRAIPEAKKRGANLIVIDPVRTGMAAMADQWLQVEPGTDAALGLAMLHVIINEELFDAEFVARWTVGFNELRDHVRGATPKWAERITKVPAESIARAARTYARAKPASMVIGNGLEGHTNAVDMARAAAMLVAVTGNLDVPGGNVFFPTAELARYPTVRPNARRIGADTYPLLPNAPFPSLVDAILTGKPYQPRAMLVAHANPVLAFADEKRIRQAISKLDFVLVLDIFRTATAELADVILPAACDFERVGLREYTSSEGAFVSLRRKVVEPPPECRPWYDVERDLAARMGLDSQYPWRTGEDFVNYRLRPLGLTVEDLEQKHFVYVTKPPEYRKYLKEGFRTPSGKVEFYSQQANDLGYGPLPVHCEPAESHVSKPHLTSRFPLIGTSRRSGMYIHTRYRNLPSLRKREPDCLVRIHPDDAGQRGIKDGDLTVVESPVGSVSVKAKVSLETRPGTVVMDYGWGNPWDGQANVNILTSDEARDTISSTTSNRRFLCEVTKA